MSSNTHSTLLDAFLGVARLADSAERDVVECGLERWSYSDLDAISTGLAVDMKAKYGPKPVVAVISENHPYVLAALFATWKLGGIFAPLDHHAPPTLMERMLTNISPSCVIASSGDVHIRDLVKGLDIPLYPFTPKESTITALAQRFLDQSAAVSSVSHAVPTGEDIALYLHTSSASSVSNLKCVPLTHQTILNGSEGRISWWQKTWPQQSFAHLRVFGWSPWSHVIGVSHDIGAATILTSGCYIFALTPATYHTEAGQSSDLTISALLLEAAIKKKPTAFAGVPWVVEGFMDKWKSETDVARQQLLSDVLCHFKVIGSGGAKTSPECISWANDLGLPLLFDLGMTEVGGPLFHQSLDDTSGYAIGDCFIPDAELFLTDDSGERCASEGELVIISKRISQGYLRHDSEAFSADTDGSITFRTGDIYERTSDDCLIWKGRKEEFIQLSSGESIDPRTIESTINQCSAIAQSCVVGNKFLRGPANFICAIIELTSEAANNPQASMSEVTKAIAAANRTLAPPLRIAWSRVLFLPARQHLPFTKKGSIFRKKLEELFEVELSRVLNQSNESLTLSNISPSHPAAALAESSNMTRDQVEEIILIAVSEALKIPVEMLMSNSQATFAELGMDSAMATVIVNTLNRRLHLALPMNTCHTHVDLLALTEALCVQLGLSSHGADVLSKGPAQTSQAVEEVVIVGQSLRLPGDLNTPESFWQALIEKRNDLLTRVPEDRWDHDSFYRPPTSTEPPQPCDITFEKSGFIDIAHYDNSFFGISSAEALHVSPVIRLTLETAFEALENANIPISRVKGTNMAVYVAAGVDEGYNKLLFLEKGFAAYSRFYGTGVAISTACGRLSYLLDIHGPSITVDTACSSGLVAFDEAVNYLRSGQGESAIVCSANTHTWPGTYGFLSAQKMTSINSRCATFTNEADGYGASEGAIAVVLKTRSAALRDGDTILAVVRSTDVQHDGRSQGLVAPNVKAQISMQRSLLYKASLTASQIDFIETHGTGTSLGDLIEIQAINEVFQSSHSPERPLILGAAKTCVGHAELAAGLVGVVKAIGSLTNSSVPGLVHLTPENMNPALDCTVVPLHIPYKTAVLKRHEDSHQPFRTLILANGFAGTIAGTILEGPERRETPPDSVKSGQLPTLFVLSAKTQDALRQYLKDYLEFCRKASASDFHSICYTTCVGREHYKCRFACAVMDMEDLIQRLEQQLSSDVSAKSNPGPRRILFGFPGQGCQYQGMARDLSQRYSGFMSIISEAANKAAESSGYPILSLLVDAQPSSDLNIDQSEVAQICIFVYQYSISRWLQSLDILPQAVMGHSLGEIAAAVIAGAMSFELGLQFAIVRAQLLRADPERPGAMAAVAAEEDVVLQYITTLGLNGRLVVAVYNGAKSHVVSGERGAVDMLVAAVKADGLRATRLNVDQGFHSPCIKAALPSLKIWFKEHEHLSSPLKIPMFSTALGTEISKDQKLGTQYWVLHAQNPVKFYQAAAEIARSKTIDVILDVGPQPTFWSNLQTPDFSEKVTLAAVGKRGKNQEFALLGMLSRLFESGLTPNFSVLFAQTSERHTTTNIPTYPFQKQRHYPTYIASRNSAPLVGKSNSPARPQKTVHPFAVDQALCDMLDEHRIEGNRVLPGAASLDFFARASAAKSVKSIRFHKPLVLETPDSTVRGETEESGDFILYQGDGKICSGSIAFKAAYDLRDVAFDGHPSRELSHDDIYACFNNVQFGLPFRNIQNIKIWPDHADAYIRVLPSKYPAHDRIRKLDSCMHMFGAIALKEVPDLATKEGAFLPSSLEEFSLHSDDIPSSFICRYYLPLTLSRNSHVITVAFEVLSHEGELLVSCKRYSVAWVPAGVVIQPGSQVPVASSPKPWLLNQWDARPLPDRPATGTSHRFQELLFVGIGSQPRLLEALKVTAQHTIFVELPDRPEGKCIVRHNEHTPAALGAQMDGLADLIKGDDLSIVVDVTSINAAAGSKSFSTFCCHVLMFLKLLTTRRVHISSFLVVSSMSAPVYVMKDDSEDADIHNEHHELSVGAIVQGMLRVFRREMSLDKVAWGIDLPSLDIVPDSLLNEIIAKEIHSRYEGLATDTIAAYRSKKSEQPMIRLAPVMQRMERKGSGKLSGTAIIVGMGSIGYALAPDLISAGCSHVVFLGRRSPVDSAIKKELDNMMTQTNGCCSYVQVDICDQTALRTAFTAVQLRFGPIENIIHTAAVVKDATINSVSFSAFEDVTNPKVIGAWNLHIVSEELGLPLKTFAMLSSIQVLLGNPGQVAYVSGNAFMDSLASYRHSRGLPGTSMQLGVWESKLLENLDLAEGFVHLIYHKQGIPLIIQAMTVPVPVQVIADWDIPKLSMTPAYARDPFFATILPTTSGPSTAGKISKAEAIKKVTDILRSILELRPNEELDTEESLTSCGIDSIAFAQIRGSVLKDLEVEVPMIYLSDTYSMSDMIENIATNF